MELLILSLIVIISAWLYYRYKKALNYFEDLGIPYIPGSLISSITGIFFPKKHPSEYIITIYNFNSEAKYVGMFEWLTPIFVLRDQELIKNVTIKHFDNFPDHRSLIDEKFDPLFGGNLFNIKGDRWRETRNLVSPVFTSSKMKANFEPMIECSRKFLDYIEQQPDISNKNVDTKNLFTRYTCNVIATCAFGLSVDSLKDPNNEFYTLAREATDFNGTFILKILFGRLFPQLIKLLRIKFISDKVRHFFTNIVSNTVAMRDEKHINRPDIIQLLMDSRGKEYKHFKIDLTQMTAQSFIFLFGGLETTSTQMCLLAHELAINSDVQKKLQEEIDDVLNETDEKPTYDVIMSMPYLDAVFNELMRMHPQVVNLDRVCASPFELPPALPGGKPIMLQPGMSVSIPVKGIHSDPKYYENPKTFDPSRYLNKKVNINDTLNLGFGIGPRSCIGNRFAILQTKVLFFFLLSKYNLKPNEKTCSPLVYNQKLFSLTPEGGFTLAIEPRD